MPISLPVGNTCKAFQKKVKATPHNSGMQRCLKTLLTGAGLTGMIFAARTDESSFRGRS